MKSEDIFGGIMFFFGAVALGILGLAASTHEEEKPTYLLEEDPYPFDADEIREYLRKTSRLAPITRIRSISFREVDLILGKTRVSAINTDNEEFCLVRAETPDGYTLLEKVPYAAISQVKHVLSTPPQTEYEA